MVAHEALVRSAFRCITCFLQHHPRDRVRLVRIPIACMLDASAAAEWLQIIAMSMEGWPICLRWPHQSSLSPSRQP